MRQFVIFALIILCCLAADPMRCVAQGKVSGKPDVFYIPQLHYGGGGDWYEDRTSMVRLQARLAAEFGLVAGAERKIIKIMDDDLFSWPMIFMTGHGNVVFTDEEATRLKLYFERGGFLWVSDDYGIDKALRREMQKVFPGKDFVVLPFDHPIYNAPYRFPNGLPKVHEHAGGPPHGYAMMIGDRVAVFYDSNTDIADGLESPEVHKDPEEVRKKAFEMAVNIAFLAMSR